MVVVKMEKHARSITTGGDRDMAIIIVISYQSYCVRKGEVSQPF